MTGYLQLFYTACGLCFIAFAMVLFVVGEAAFGRVFLVLFFVLYGCSKLIVLEEDKKEGEGDG